MKAMLATWMAPVTYPKAQLWQMIEETKIQVCWLLFCPLISLAFICPHLGRWSLIYIPKRPHYPKHLRSNYVYPILISSFISERWRTNRSHPFLAELTLTQKRLNEFLDSEHPLP